MNKKILIITSSILVLLLGIVWAYLLIFGTPTTPNDIFTNLGQEGEVAAEQPINAVVPNSATSSLNVSRAKLRQLTTKPIAGFGTLPASTSTTPSVLFAELGTGHIYTINLVDGTETRISGTTFAQTDTAQFSPDGTLVALGTNSQTKTKPILFGKIATTTKEVVEILDATTTTSFALTNTELLYTTTGTEGVVGYSYNQQTNTKTHLFSVPFAEATIIWGDRANAPHYVYPKSTTALEGFLYEATKTNLLRLPVSGFGLTAKINNDIVLYSKIVNNKPASFIYNRNTKETKPFTNAILTDKCFLPTEGELFFCAHAETTETNLPDLWYQGAISFKDTLYALSAEKMLAELLINTFTETNRELDITELTLGSNGRSLFFINKNDNSLWLYEF